MVRGSGRIGVVDGMKGAPKHESLKSLCAAAAASGSVTLLHIVGVTPEARTLEEAFGPKKPVDEFIVTAEDLLKTRNSMCTYKGDEIDFVALGCPQYTINRDSQRP